MYRKCCARSYRDRGAEKGEAEVTLFITAVVVLSLISGGIWLIGWIRGTKDAKVERRAIAQLSRQTPVPFVRRVDPGEYLASCKKPLWAALSTTVPCEILPESYREIEAASTY